MEKFKPFVGVGYTLANFRTNFGGVGQSDEKNNYGGLNINLGAAYDISNSLFVHAQFDTTNLSRDGLGNNRSFFSNINLLKFGVGLRF